MPQVVSAFLETRDLDAAQAMQNHLLKSYDRELQALPNLLQKKVRSILSQIPVQLSQPLKTFTLTRLSQEVRFRQLARALSWLQDGHWVELCHRVIPGKPGFQDGPQRRSFIGYAADTGLLVAQAIDLGLVSQNEVRQSLLYGSLQFAGGMFFHNAVAQMLAAAGHPLCFYTGHGAAGGTIDFLLRRQKKMLPVIVRSSGYRSHPALDALSRQFPRQVAAGTIVYPKDRCCDGALTALPAYMTFCL